MTDVQKLNNLQQQLAAAPAGEGRARIQLELGELLLERGDYGQALVHFAAARAQPPERAAGKVRRRIELGTALALLRRGEPDRAEPHLERLLEAARARRDREAEARALLHLGEIYRRRGEAARAAAALERARAWLEAHPRGPLLATAYTSLAELAQAAGDLDGALELAGDAVDLAAGAFAAVEEIAALLTVGPLYARKRDWAGAEAALSRAMELAATSELPRELAEAQLAYAQLVGGAGDAFDRAQVGEAAAWVARAQAIFKDHGALGDLERVRRAFRAFGRRATDRVATHAVEQLGEELSRARRDVGLRAHQLIDAVEQGIDRVDDDLLPPERARLHGLRAAAVECERAVSGGVAALGDAEGRVLAALQSLVIERENMRTLLDQIRLLHALDDGERLPLEACKAAAQLTGADRCVLALLSDGKLVARAALRVADVEAEPAWRAAMQSVIGGAGPMLLMHEAARERDGELRLGKAMATPLRHGDTVFGAVYVDKELCGGLFGAHELELLSSLCAQVATMLAEARRGDEATRARRTLAGLIDALPDALLALDGDGALVAMNAAATQLLGEPPALAPFRSILEQRPQSPASLRVGGHELSCRVRPLPGAGAATGGALITLTPLESVTAMAQALARPSWRSFADVAGRAPALKRRLQQAEAAARGDAPVLFVGEPGTGKRLFAEALHAASPRHDGPLVPLHCAAAPRARLDAELFGPRGALALAGGGTLLVDEIGELPLDLQARLVQILDNSDVRLVATTARDLERDVAERRFRRELWSLLSRTRLVLPPLRARPGDVPLLIQRLLPPIAARLHKQVRAVAPPVLTALARHGWPGNVRELERWLELEVARAADGQTRLERPPEGLRPAPTPRAPRAPRAAAPTLADMERELLVRALMDQGGSIPDVARQLGVSRGTVYNQLRRFSLDPERFRG